MQKTPRKRSWSPAHPGAAVDVLRGIDIRTLGSGNPGATNVWRTLGFKFGIAVALLDIQHRDHRTRRFHPT